MKNYELTSFIKATPRPSYRGGRKGGSQETIQRRSKLQQSPGDWFLWKENASYGSDSGQALRSLIGVLTLKGVDRNTLPYEATSRRNENGTWNIYVRYVGEERQYAESI